VQTAAQIYAKNSEGNSEGLSDVEIQLAFKRIKVGLLVPGELAND
jgi:hypothetical protein